MDVPKTVTKVPEKSGMYCNDRIYLSTLFLSLFDIEFETFYNILNSQHDI